MSSYENDSPTSLKIANYFFEVGLTNESLNKQFAKQLLNEESMNNRRKLKRLLSNANPEGLMENREFFQNYRRNENFSSITESINSLSTNNGSVAISSISSLYHSDESLEGQKVSNNEFSEIQIPVPSSIKEKSNTSFNSNAANAGSVTFADNILEKELPATPKELPSPPNENSNDNTNENSNNNTNENSNDNTNENSNNNTNENSNNNTNENSNDNTNENSNDNTNENSNDNTNENTNDDTNENKSIYHSFIF